MTEREDLLEDIRDQLDRLERSVDTEEYERPRYIY